MKTNNKGFSLVELIVVIAIMAILAAVAIPTFASFIDKANVASDVSFVNDLEYAAQLAHTTSGKDVTDVQISVNEDGEITAAAYKVGGVAVVINATAKTANSENDEYKKAAADVVASMDWTYTFKKYKNDTFAVDSTDAKALTGDVTVIEITEPEVDNDATN